MGMVHRMVVDVCEEYRHEEASLPSTKELSEFHIGLQIDVCEQIERVKR
jgi:hypothetical protein